MTYNHRAPGAILSLENADLLTEADSAATVRVIYLSRAMLAVVAVGLTWDLPDMIRVRFHAEDDVQPAPARECYLLTETLWERAWAALVRDEAKAERGEIDAKDWSVLRARVRVVQAMRERSDVTRMWEY